MKIEVDKFKDMTQELAQKCQVKYIPQSKLPNDQQLYGQDIFGYEILGKEEHPQCQWIAMDEMKFMDYVRKMQNQKILSSKYSYHPLKGNGTAPTKVNINQSYDKKYKRLKPRKNKFV